MALQNLPGFCLALLQGSSPCHSCGQTKPQQHRPGTQAEPVLGSSHSSKELGRRASHELKACKQQLSLSLKGFPFPHVQGFASEQGTSLRQLREGFAAQFIRGHACKVKACEARAPFPACWGSLDCVVLSAMCAMYYRIIHGGLPTMP